jgi:hypothetical protein
MLLLVTKAHPTMVRLKHPNLGRLAVPRDHARMDETAAAGIPWAADNSAFSAFDAEAFLAMIDHLNGVPGGLFVVAPDLVGDAAATLDAFARWAPEIRQRCLPIALAAQNGLERLTVPWDDLDALFIGGIPDPGQRVDWKLSPAAAQLVAEANRRGKWTHMGRANSGRRFEYAKAIGCRSVDGSKFSRFTNTWLPDGLAAAGAPPQLQFGAAE